MNCKELPSFCVLTQLGWGQVGHMQGLGVSYYKGTNTFMGAPPFPFHVTIITSDWSHSQKL